MTIAFNCARGRWSHTLPLPPLALTSVLAIGLGAAGSLAATPPPAPTVVILPPSPAQQFQQTVQQQQLTDNLQKSQLQQQLQQNVSDMGKRPSAAYPQAVQQSDAADHARQQREQAHERAMIEREQSNAALPVVVPQALPSPTGGG